MTEPIIRNEGIRVQGAYEPPRNNQGRVLSGRLKGNEDIQLFSYAAQEANRDGTNQIVTNTKLRGGYILGGGISRLVTWNVHSWVTPGESKNSFPNFLKVIQDLHPDILLLQENNRPTDQLLTQLVTKDGQQMFFFAADCKTTEGLSNVILSRYAFSTKRGFPFAQMGSYPAKKRCFTTVQFNDALGNACLQVVSTHLAIYTGPGGFRGKDTSTNKTIRAEEAKVILRSLDRANTDLGSGFSDNCAKIVAGDFNDDYQSQAVQTFVSQGWQDVFHTALEGSDQDLPKWSSKNPNNRIDFILYDKASNVQWRNRIKGCYVYYTDASDHLPLVMDFKSTLKGSRKGGQKSGDTHLQSTLTDSVVGADQEESFRMSIEEASKKRLNSEIPKKKNGVFRVVSWNVNFWRDYKGFDPGSKDNFDQVKSEIKNLNPDALLLQNVVNSKNRRAGTILNDLLGGGELNFQTELKFNANQNPQELKNLELMNLVLVKKNVKKTKTESGNLLKNENPQYTRMTEPFNVNNNFRPGWVSMVVDTPSGRKIQLLTAYINGGNGVGTKSTEQTIKAEAKELLNKVQLRDAVIGVSAEMVGTVPNQPEDTLTANGSVVNMFRKVGAGKMPTWTTIDGTTPRLADNIYISQNFDTATSKLLGAYLYYSTASNHLALILDILDSDSLKDDEPTDATPLIDKNLQPASEANRERMNATTTSTPKATSPSEPLQPGVSDDLTALGMMPQTAQQIQKQQRQMTAQEAKTKKALDTVTDTVSLGLKGMATALKNSKIIVDGTSPCPQADFLPCFRIDSGMAKSIIDYLISPDLQKKASDSRAKNYQRESQGLRLTKRKGKPNYLTEEEVAKTSRSRRRQTGGKKRKHVRYTLTRRKNSRKKEHVGGSNDDNNAEELSLSMGVSAENKAQTRRAFNAFGLTLQSMADEAKLNKLKNLPLANLPQADRIIIGENLRRLGAVAASVLANYGIRQQTSLIRKPGDLGLQTVTVDQFNRFIADLNTTAEKMSVGPIGAGPANQANVFFWKNYLRALKAAIRMGDRLSSQVHRFLETVTEKRMMAAAMLSYIARLLALGMEDNVDVLRQHLRLTQKMEVDEAVLKLAKYLRNTTNLEPDQEEERAKKQFQQRLTQGMSKAQRSLPTKGRPMTGDELWDRKKMWSNADSHREYDPLLRHSSLVGSRLLTTSHGYSEPSQARKQQQQAQKGQQSQKTGQQQQQKQQQGKLRNPGNIKKNKWNKLSKKDKEKVIAFYQSNPGYKPPKAEIDKCKKQNKYFIGGLGCR